MAITFTIPSLIVMTPIINGTLQSSASLRLTDHNRQPLAITTERIEKSARMANGTLRKYVINSKYSFATSWTELPNSSASTVDGFGGADAVQTFYETYNGQPIRLTIRMGSAGVIDVYDTFFSDFSLTLSKRSLTNYDMYDMNISWEQI